MDSDRIEVFHVTDGDGRVVAVPHDLILDLLVALYAFFHKDLRNGRNLKRMTHLLPQFLFVPGKSPSGSAEGEGRPQNNRVDDFLRDPQSLLRAAGNGGRNDRLVQALA